MNLEAWANGGCANCGNNRGLAIYWCNGCYDKIDCNPFHADFKRSADACDAHAARQKQQPEPVAQPDPYVTAVDALIREASFPGAHKALCDALRALLPLHLAKTGKRGDK